jgi:beta-glucanase (GH16 family)
MEFYRINDVPHILANAAWGTGKPGNAKWNSAKIPFTHFTEKDPAWASKFHTWRMDWDETAIQLFLDDELLNTINLAGTKNGGTLAGINPFQQSHYLLLNLAIGGDNGGKIDLSAFPLKYEIDYVRVYQQQ